MIKRISAIAIAVLFAGCLVAMTGCATSGFKPEKSETKLSQPTIGVEGTLRVGVKTSDNAPFAAQSGKIVGIDVDVAAALADKLGLRLELVDYGTDPVGAIKNGKVDIVMGLSSSETYDGLWVSDPYFTDGAALFAQSSTTDLPTSGAKNVIAAQISSLSAKACTQAYGSSAVSGVSSPAKAFEELSAGTVKFAAADAAIGYYVANNAGISATAVAMLEQPKKLCVGLISTNTELKKAVWDSLAYLVDYGTVKVIQAKWFGTNVDLTTLPVVSAALITSTADEVSAVVSASTSVAD